MLSDDCPMLICSQGFKPLASSGSQRLSPLRLLPSRRRWSTARRTATKMVLLRRWTRPPSLSRPAHRVRVGQDCGFHPPLSHSNPPGRSCCPRLRGWGVPARHILKEVLCEMSRTEKMVGCIIGICGARVIDASRHAENEVMYDLLSVSWLYVYVCMICQGRGLPGLSFTWYTTRKSHRPGYILHGTGSAKRTKRSRMRHDQCVWGDVVWVVELDSQWEDGVIYSLYSIYEANRVYVPLAT